MPRGSFKHEDSYNPLQEIETTVADYIKRQFDGIEEVYSEPNNKGLFIGLRLVTDTQEGLLLTRVDAQVNQEPCESISGLYSLDELFILSIERPESIIEDLVNEGETTLIAGRPKVGKSRIVQQMTLSLANGTPFLGMNVPRPRRVLLVDIENKPWAIKDRLTRMTGQEAPKNENVFVYCSGTLAENTIDSSEQGIKRLNILLDKTHADVLIIDPWRLWLNKEENDALEVVRGLKALTSLRSNRPGLAIIIVHHIRKERFESPAKLIRDPSLWVENISGHYALVGHVDACYGLERQIDDDGETVVFGGVARNNEPRTILLDDDPETLRFEVADTEEAAKIAMTQKERELWERAKRKRQFTWSAFFADAGTTNKKLISSMLKKALAHSLIEKTERGYRVIVGG